MAQARGHPGRCPHRRDRSERTVVRLACRRHARHGECHRVPGQAGGHAEHRPAPGRAAPGVVPGDLPGHTRVRLWLSPAHSGRAAHLLQPLARHDPGRGRIRRATGQGVPLAQRRGGHDHPAGHARQAAGRTLLRRSGLRDDDPDRGGVLAVPDRLRVGRTGQSPYRAAHLLTCDNTYTPGLTPRSGRAWAGAGK